MCHSRTVIKMARVSMGPLPRIPLIMALGVKRQEDLRPLQKLERWNLGIKIAATHSDEVRGGDLELDHEVWRKY
jgi:hypothetical protein